ncbi:hypothetical protein OIU85_029118 [Salix viminalis]|uniref:Knottin scorpion toxin-like domain-containing protein n=1 Tax=Salix viminalis TaxID=40686 RepID=A0A9Q0T6S3_SALVM|nr:hypothetical protein OIU85_029118 [Salix viminalis]
MAVRHSCVKIMIIAIMVIALLLSAGEAAPICVERCGVHPDCNDFCNRLGYRGGQCLPPVYVQCCCNR